MEQISKPVISVFENIAHLFFTIFRVTSSLTFDQLTRSNPKPLPPIADPILNETASELAQRIRKRILTSHEVTLVYINRIKTVNGSINALVDQRFENALKEALKVDEFLKNTDKTEEEIKRETPFLGVPFTVKGSLGVEGLHHTVGIYSRKDIIADADADIVGLMRKAGAIPLCVTNTAELCCWWESFNPLYGTTKNPHNTNHTAGGSSGGEGALIAAGGSIMGLGSDFGGSIRIPAAFNGIFGHRPTSSTVSLKGHYPLPPNAELQKFLVTGPMTRFASDLLPIMKVLSSDSRLKLEDEVDVTKIKVYYMDEGADNFLVSPVQPDIKKSIRRAAEYLKNSWGITVKQVNLKKLKYAMLYWCAKIKTEGSPQLGKELANHKGSVNISAELLKFLVGKSKHTLPVLVFGMLEKHNIAYKGRIHKALLQSFDELQRELQGILGDDGIFLYPTHPTTAPRHKEAITRPFDIGYSSIFNVLEMPATSCPAGFDSNQLPISIQIVSNKYNDKLTIAVAVELEKCFGGWQLNHRPIE